MHSAVDGCIVIDDLLQRIPEPIKAMRIVERTNLSKELIIAFEFQLWTFLLREGEGGIPAVEARSEVLLYDGMQAANNSHALAIRLKSASTCLLAFRLQFDEVRVQRFDLERRELLPGFLGAKVAFKNVNTTILGLATSPDATSLVQRHLPFYHFDV